MSAHALPELPGGCETLSERQEANSPWYALRVRPRWEKLVTTAISGKDYEVFLPVYRKTREWSDRSKVLDCPLFPGYVFWRGNLSRQPRLVSTPGVIGILNFGGIPAVISEGEIDGLRVAISSGALVEPWQYVREGERVRVYKGSLSGLEGILIRTKRDCRVVLSVESLYRSVAVEVDRDSIAPLSSRLLT
ncbi:MAG: UpxY family transcription antiterminator [Bryobacteraceae bacterium]